MKLLSLNSAALALLVLGLVVPTGAVMQDGDEVWQGEGIVLSPHDGPNGGYASIGDDGNLSVNLADSDALNANAVTRIEGIFDATNRGTESRLVWITHDAAERVEFHADGSGSMQGVEQAVRLEPGETVVVGLVADTRGVSSGTRLLGSLAIHSRRASTSTTTESSGGSGGGGGAPPTNETPTPEPTPTDGPGDDEVVEVEFSAAVEDDERATITPLEDVPAEQDRGEPRAVVERVRGGVVPPPDVDGRSSRADSIALVDEEITLSGTSSTVGSVEAADRGRRVVKVVDISVPDRLEDEPAAVRMTVRREKLDDSDLSRARVARLTEDGWQLLPTRIERQDATHVTFRARTPGFSVFAVLASNDVTYRWELEGKGTYAGEELNVSYDRPGIYDATLTVTDAFGRSASRNYRILVNDRPAVSIEGTTGIEPGRPATLRANVTDAFGNVTVRWTFEDGTTAVGPTVTRSFERGEHVVRVTAEDEYGATGGASEMVQVGRPTTTPAIDVVRYALGFEGRLVLVAVLAIALLGASRWLLGRRR